MLLVLADNENERGIALITKLIDDVEIKKYEVYNSTLSDELDHKKNFWVKIKQTKPKVIMTAGSLSTRLILGLKKNFKLADSVGKIYIRDWTTAWIIPIYGGTYLLQRGKAKLQETASLLNKINKQRLQDA